MTTERSNPRGIQKSKILGLIMIPVLMLVCGIVLTACGSKTFTVTFDKNTDAAVTGMPAEITGVKKNATITAPTEPTSTTHDFKGWFKEAECTTEWNWGEDEVTKNETLYAKWVVKPAEPTAPDAVTELTATEIGSNNVLLEWIAPANNGGSVVTGYEVRHRKAASTWSAWTDEIAPEYNFTGLDTGIRYEFQVRAVNAKGAGVEESIVVVPFRVELDGTQVAWTDAEMPTGFNGYVLEFTFVDAGEVFYHSIIGTTNDLELAGFDWSAIGVNFGEDGYEGGVEIRVALRPTGKLPLSHTLRYSTNFVTAEVTIEPIYPELIAPMIAWDATDNELIVWNVVDANADGIRVHVRVRVPFGKGWLWISLASGELDLSEVSLGLGAIPEILGIEEFDLGEHSIRLEVYSNNLEVASAFSNMLNFTVS